MYTSTKPYDTYVNITVFQRVRNYTYKVCMYLHVEWGILCVKFFWLLHELATGEYVTIFVLLSIRIYNYSDQFAHQCAC